MFLFLFLGWLQVFFSGNLVFCIVFLRKALEVFGTMNSYEANNLMKIHGQRSRLWKTGVIRDSNGICKSQVNVTATGGVSAPVERKEQVGTDYHNPVDLKNAPLKLRRRYTHTAWPAQNRKDPVSVLPQSRNQGNIVWRRYPDGELDFTYAMQMVIEALRRYKEGPVINEIDALIITSVLPNIKFESLPRKIVDEKAPLLPEEAKQLREVVREQLTDRIIRDIVDLGGA